MISVLLTRNQSVGQKWRRIFIALYAICSAAFALAGRFEFAAAYLIIVLFLSLKSTNFDLFAPAPIAVHAFGLYFLLPLSVIKGRAPEAFPIVAGTMLCFFAFYLLLPKLNFGQGRWLGDDRKPRKNMVKIAIWMQVIGYILFVFSTILAGYSNPLGVLSDPVTYRFFMMQGGMSYFSSILFFLNLGPSLAIAVAYYSGDVKRRHFLLIALAAVFYGLTTGARGSVVFAILHIVAVRHFLYKKVSATLVITMTCIFLPFIAIAGQYRTVAYANESGALSRVISNMTLSDGLEIAASRADAAEMFNELVENYRHNEPKWGLSYLGLPVQVIPRSMWEDKPRMPNPEMTRIVGKDDPLLDIAFDFGIFGETYINFKWLCIPVGGLMIALVVGFMQATYEYTLRTLNPVCVLVCSNFFMIPFSLVTSGLSQVMLLGLIDMTTVFISIQIFFPKIRTKRSLWRTSLNLKTLTS
jgi:hypothetical protein